MSGGGGVGGGENRQILVGVGKGMGEKRYILVGVWKLRGPGERVGVGSEEIDTGRCGEGEYTWERGWRRDRSGVGKWDMGERVERESEILVGVRKGDMSVTCIQTDRQTDRHNDTGLQITKQINTKATINTK